MPDLEPYLKSILKNEDNKKNSHAHFQNVCGTIVGWPRTFLEAQENQESQKRWLTFSRRRPSFKVFVAQALNESQIYLRLQEMEKANI